MVTSHTHLGIAFKRVISSHSLIGTIRISAANLMVGVQLFTTFRV